MKIITGFRYKFNVAWWLQKDKPEDYICRGFTRMNQMIHKSAYGCSMCHSADSPKVRGTWESHWEKSRMCQQTSEWVLLRPSFTGQVHWGNNGQAGLLAGFLYNNGSLVFSTPGATSLWKTRHYLTLNNLKSNKMENHSCQKWIDTSPTKICFLLVQEETWNLLLLRLGQSAGCGFWLDFTLVQDQKALHSALQFTFI